MKAEFTLVPRTGIEVKFEVEAPKAELDWLEQVLVVGARGVVVRRDVPYQPEPEAPWPTGPILEDM